jgi:hypothetical protein
MKSRLSSAAVIAVALLGLCAAAYATNDWHWYPCVPVHASDGDHILLTENNGARAMVYGTTIKLLGGDGVAAVTYSTDNHVRAVVKYDAYALNEEQPDTTPCAGWASVAVSFGAGWLGY